ncbi:fasciclin domain-containing protein [Croceitalea sp. MTPC9]|uniref:fasciclin domain-containing protein n=1 Tax=unclassified Croceitalea TaxID=2632280 RepID=UPI002B36E700|nr:fasciclin domain-containing protein [Croceitalea sp. MTPC6]GMN15532.1 fasciclin domain-containing protein [Croceitalea sp. MTPC9]
MKIPHKIAYLSLAFFCLNFSFAQNTDLNTSRSEVYKTESNNHIQEAIATENHKTLIAALKSTDLEESLDENVPFTIFAPSDIAFSKLSPSKLKELLNSDDKNELKSVLKYHIVAGKLTASKILKALCRGKGKATFTTIQGNKITATMRGLDIILTDSMGNSAKITVADSTQGNGVMHEIDSVILPTRI